MGNNEYDFTSLSTWQTCQRKYYYRHVRGLVGKVEATAPNFGKAIHAGLDSWYTDKDVTKAVDVFKSNYVEDLVRDDKRTHKMGEWILTNYDAKYRDQPHELIKTEHSFRVPLANGNFLIGRIDKIVRWNNALWVIDHKTTSQLGANYFKMAEPNMQFDIYTYAARAEGYPVVGVIVDALLVAKGLLDSTQRTRLTPLARFDCYRSDDHMAESMDTILSIQSEIDRCRESGVWLPNYGACTDYGECAYRRVDMEDRDIRERIIQSDYKVEFWSPLTTQEATA